MEKLLVEFARHADRTKFALHFVSLTDRGPLAQEIESYGWPVAAMGKADGLQARLVFQLARFFRRKQIDVVHTHNNASLIYGGPAGRLSGVAGIIHTRHGRSCRASRRQRALFQVSSHLSDDIVCVSEDAKKLSKTEGIALNKLSCIRNGIDISSFSYSGPRQDGPVVVIARLSPEKDVETLLRAVAMIKHLPECPHFEIAGAGPCLFKLLRLSSELGLDECVRFLGQIRNIPELLAQASLFVLPSRSEGISLTLLEAMAVGLPVVTTLVGGNPEVVSQEETGLLVPAGNAAQLASAITKILRDPERGYQMGLAGRMRIEQYFDVRRMVRAYESIYLKHRPSIHRASLHAEPLRH